MQNIPEGADIDFELELLGFDKQPNWHDAEPDEKIRRAQTLKEQGNAIFKQGAPQYPRARSKWTKALKMLDNAFDLDTEEQVRNMAPTTDAETLEHLMSCQQHSAESCIGVRVCRKQSTGLMSRVSLNAGVSAISRGRVHDLGVCRTCRCLLRAR